MLLEISLSSWAGVSFLCRSSGELRRGLVEVRDMVEGWRDCGLEGREGVGWIEGAGVGLIGGNDIIFLTLTS